MSLANGEKLPGGTVTFLFLDIEGSTGLIERLGAEYPRVLETYRNLTDEVVSRRGGMVFGSEGDGLFLAFPEAGASATSAVEMQRAFYQATWPGGAAVRVRMGVHTGTPTLIGDDYTGLDVHRAARIMSAGWGGQVLISETTQSLLVGSELGTRELGWYAMRGLSRQERLYQIVVPGLPADFPPLRARRREVELPVSLTSLIGREDDIEAVIRLLRGGSRLITLTGPGGIGKSRVAIAVAERLDPDYADGVSYVDVSNETDPARVAVTVAENIGVVSDPHQTAFEALVAHLSPLHLLLVIDGFEPVIVAAAQIAEVLAKCPRLQILVTSRAALRIGAEREHRVDPLPVAHAGEPVDRIAASPAVRLFVERARTVRPDLDVTGDNAKVVRDLVATLEGNPLSIELAAARARLLTAGAILERLENVLDLGTSSPELPMRQRSLRATIEWSHGLLDPADQKLLRRLGVFVDGWTIEAAESVAGEDETDAFLGLENLVAQSLVRVEVDGRMSMGTALREFAVEQLGAAGDEDETRLRHALFFADLAEASEPLMRGPRQRDMVTELSRDWGNFRSAADWALRQDQVALAGRLYVNTWILSWQGDNWSESISYTRRLVDVFDRLDEPTRAKALFVAAGTFMEIGDGETAITYARPAVEVSRRLGDRATEAWSRLILAGSTLFGDMSDPEARDQIDRALELARAIDDPFLLAYGLSFKGAIATLDGDMAAGLASHRESLTLARQLDNLTLTTQALSQQAMTHLAAGAANEARAALEEGAEYVDDLRSLEVLAVFLDAVAWLAFVEGDQVRAMTALGAANATRSRVGAVRWALLAALLDATGLAAEAEHPALAEARRAGGEMSPKDAIALAMQPHHELAATG